ncbi:hypothetical protein C8R47DRAFT_384885 [Mycena vitilis]|nr:hypothetical protein C8R47DRAFT_384885 [Mycena vitilis]
MLCSNRFPMPGSPSTCTIDTAIVPLPSFFLFIALAVNWTVSRRNAAKLRITPVKWLHITYLVLVGAQVAMTVLELVRLVLENLGVGLLPINTVALLCLFAILWRGFRSGRTRMTISVSCSRLSTLHSLILHQIMAVYWFFMTIFEAIKTARLHTLEELNPTTTKTSQYPSSDWLLDNAVMLALYFIFFCTETVTLLLSRNQRNAEGVYKMRSHV